MENSLILNYQRIEKAIAFIRENFKRQPDLDEIAEHIHLSPYHFQRLFKEWAGVSPKKFLQYISLDYAKELLRAGEVSIGEATYQTGLSGTGRLHDLFVNIEGMTPGEFKNGGKNLSINYSFAESHFGKLIVASTEKGICHISFSIDGAKSVDELKTRFPNAQYREFKDKNQEQALTLFSRNWKDMDQVKLHLKGTDFQLKVWEALINIPVGSLSTYGQIAEQLNKPKASRAVGTAIGNNPVAYLIPCHRVIRGNGQFGQYHWGEDRKTAIIGWEGANQ